MARRSPARRARPRRRRPRGAGSARDRSRPGRARAHAIGAARPARRRAARRGRAGGGGRRGRPGGEPPAALALALALGAPSEPILSWVTDLSGVALEIGGDDLLAAGVPEGPAIGRSLDETLRRKFDALVQGRAEERRTALGLAR